MKRFAAAIVAIVATFVAVAPPAQATQTSDLSDVRFMTSMLKSVWFELDYDTQDTLCGYFYVSPILARNEMANTFHDPDGGSLSDYSLYDVRRAVWRLLNWGC